MAYYAVYETSTGILKSQGTTIIQKKLDGTYETISEAIARLTAAGLTAIDIVNPPADNTIWDTVTRAFVAKPSPRILLKVDFIQRFSLAERKEMFGFNFGTTYTAAQQKNLSSFMRYLDFLDRIPLDDSGIQQGVNYLETVGILAAGRAAQVLA